MTKSDMLQRTKESMEGKNETGIIYSGEIKATSDRKSNTERIQVVLVKAAVQHYTSVEMGVERDEINVQSRISMCWVI